MRLLLDTAAFLIVDYPGLHGLGNASRALVSNPDHDLLLSSVSVTEIAIKTSIGKLSYTASTVSQMISDLQVTVMDYEARHANRLFELPLHHRDPFDRMLVATAQLEQCPIVTPDRSFAKYDVQVIW